MYVFASFVTLLPKQFEYNTFHIVFDLPYVSL